MRSWVGAGVAGLTGVVVLTGCAPPAGTDGKLVDDWTVLAAPQGILPAAGHCHTGETGRTFSMLGYAPVDCAQSHITETAYVGTFSGPAAERDSPPPEASPEQRQAFTECDAKVKEYLGNDWRAGRALMHVGFPTRGAWDGGARWFKCELVEVRGMDDYGLVARNTTMKDALKSASGLALGCFQYQQPDNEKELRAVACNATHDAEFAGVFAAPDVPWVDDEVEKNRAFYVNGCYAAVARFVNVPNDSRMGSRTGLVWTSPTRQEWAAGDRGTRCYLWLDRRLTRSLRGTGNSGLPAG